jgi:hypothetical protein
MTENDIALIWEQARSVAYENPLLYRIQEQEEAADLALANNIGYWKTIYPDVKLKAEDNPDVDFRLLTKPWQKQWGNPPLVFLAVTPRKKELPKTSGWLSTLGMLAPVIAVIPVVGTIASIIVSVAAAADQKDKIQRFIKAASSVTATAFEPQFYPETFPVLLRLDEAQIAVDQPWLAPSLHKDFTRRIQEAQRRLAQEVAGQPSELTLAPNLSGDVVAVRSPGSADPANWVEQLLTAAGRPSSPTAEYQGLQTRYGSQLPTWGNVTSPESSSFFAPESPATADGQVSTASVGEGWIWLAAGALALFIFNRR